MARLLGLATGLICETRDHVSFRRLPGASRRQFTGPWRGRVHGRTTSAGKSHCVTRSRKSVSLPLPNHRLQIHLLRPSPTTPALPSHPPSLSRTFKPFRTYLAANEPTRSRSRSTASTVVHDIYACWPIARPRSPFSACASANCRSTRSLSF
jgi:hypothetical protein